MTKYRIIKKNSSYYVQGRVLWFFGWTSLGRQAPPDGGWAGPEKFGSYEKAREWVDAIMKGKKRRKSKIEIIEEI